MGLIKHKKNYSKQVETSLSKKMDFTLKILKAEKENQVFSPINITHAFGLLLHGAGGDTEKEIANILGYGKFKKRFDLEIVKILLAYVTTLKAHKL